MPLNRLEQALPLETAEFDVSRGIDNDPILKWWALHTICRIDCMVAGVNKRVRRVIHKHGIEVPTSIAHSKRLDEMNGKPM